MQKIKKNLTYKTYLIIIIVGNERNKKQNVNNYIRHNFRFRFVSFFMLCKNLDDDI